MRQLVRRLISLLQYPLPHHLISRLVHRWSRAPRAPGRRAAMGWYVRHFGVQMNEAREPDLDPYPTFNAFFTRPLRDGARPLPEDPRHLCCPVDGAISQTGKIRRGRLFQAKGQLYDLTELLGGDERRAKPFLDGAFATLYLSPAEYHRVHMPVGGTLQEMVHVPGRLFSVSPATVRNIPRLFARNERVACIFDTQAGPMALVLVGALNVGSIETVWAGEVTPPKGKRITAIRYAADPEHAIRLERGAEMGRFNLGSTVIVLCAPGRVRWAEGLEPEGKVRMGQTMGYRTD